MKPTSTILSVAALAVVAAAPLSAQAPMPMSPTVGVDAARSVYTMAKGYLMASAQQMPESLYSYRPTPAVRTFGELIGHVAGAQLMFCGAVLGNGPSTEGDIEHTVKTKAGLVDALQKSFALCDKAYATTDAAAGVSITLFGETQSKMYALTYNAAHDFEHYGNIVTYMRMNSMVPPSSQRTTTSK